ncbi:hypothetical protein [Bdellovibrio bacteriovorus]|uniref:hypothetical protein n=1 Tax=Bdellovibrio bacteriovorus TaxID=959 RepID=UPI0035A6E253
MNFLIALLLVVPAVTNAADVFPIAKVEEFIGKKMPCDLAVAHVIRAEDKRYMDCKTDCLPGDRVYCVSNGIVGQGTIKEKKGCLLNGYYMNKDRMGLLNGLYIIVEGKSCENGGFEELMSRPYGATPSVKDLLSKPIGGMVYPTVLPSKNSKFSDYLKKEIQKNK